jgi:hypothetical protein
MTQAGGSHEPPAKKGTITMIYTVIVDALGYSSGCARKGETVTEEQVGAENIARLVSQGFITQETPFVNPEAEPEVTEEILDTLAARLSVGVLPAEGYELTEPDVTWIKDIQAGVIPVPFNTDKVVKLTIAVIKERIVAFGVEPLADAKKSEYITQLNDAVVGYFENWNLEDDEA